MFPKQRKRRLRNSDSIRKIVSEINLTVNDLITPIFFGRRRKNKGGNRIYAGLLSVIT